MADAFPISGQIDPKAFPFLLIDLHRHGATGSLKVDGPSYQKALYFRGGRDPLRVVQRPARPAGRDPDRERQDHAGAARGREHQGGPGQPAGQGPGRHRLREPARAVRGGAARSSASSPTSSPTPPAASSSRTACCPRARSTSSCPPSGWCSPPCAASPTATSCCATSRARRASSRRTRQAASGAARSTTDAGEPAGAARRRSHAQGGGGPHAPRRVRGGEDRLRAAVPGRDRAERTRGSAWCRGRRRRRRHSGLGRGLDPERRARRATVRADRREHRGRAGGARRSSIPDAPRAGAGSPPRSAPAGPSPAGRLHRRLRSFPLRPPPGPAPARAAARRRRPSLPLVSAAGHGRPRHANSAARRPPAAGRRGPGRTGRQPATPPARRRPARTTSRLWTRSSTRRPLEGPLAAVREARSRRRPLGSAVRRAAGPGRRCAGPRAPPDAVLGVRAWSCAAALGGGLWYYLVCAARARRRRRSPGPAARTSATPVRSRAGGGRSTPAARARPPTATTPRQAAAPTAGARRRPRARRLGAARRPGAGPRAACARASSRRPRARLRGARAAAPAGTLQRAAARRLLRRRPCRRRWPPCDSPELFILPVNYKGRDCFRMCWGLYPSGDQATLGAARPCPSTSAWAAPQPRVLPAVRAAAVSARLRLLAAALALRRAGPAAPTPSCSPTAA